MVESLSIAVNREKGKRRWVALALLALLSVESWLLLSDISFLEESAPSGAKGAPIAELVKHRNVVRVQGAGALVWDETADGQTLYRKQSILTLDGSRAEIAFFDGTGLVLDENSLIQLEKTPGDDGPGYQRIVVRLLRGAIHKSEPRRKSELLASHGKTPEIEIRVGDAAAVLKPSSQLTVVAGPEFDGGGKIQVFSGEIEVESGNARMAVSAGEVATVSRGAAPAKERSKATPLSPLAGESVVAGAPVSLRWTDPELEAGGWTVEIARDAEFSKDVSRRPAGSGGETEVPSEVGSWYWRLIGKDGAKSPPGHFVVEAAPRPELRSPADGAMIATNTTFDLLWSRVSDAISYEVEIQRDGAIELTLEARGSTTTVNGLSAGDRKWRVRARLKDGTSTAWSEPRTFRSLDADEVAPPPPPGSIEAPEFERGAARESWIVRLWEGFVPSALADEGRTWNIRLRWGAVKGAKQYRLQLSRKSTFDQLLVQAETDSPAWTWQYQVGMENSKGRVFYRIASVSPKGEVGQFSDPIPIQIPEKILAAAGASLAAPPTAPAPILSEGEAVDAPAPVPVASSVPASEGKPTVAAAAIEEPSATISTTLTPPAPVRSPKLGLQLGLHSGVGSASQSSAAAGLSSVGLSSPYLHQKLSLGVNVDSDGELGWTSYLQAGYSKFDRPKGLRTVLQDEFSAYSLREDVLKWIEPRQGWKLAIGGTLERDYRWVKDGAQSVTADGAWSLGPVAYAIKNFEPTYAARPVELGVSLALPVTGLMTGGSYGPEASLWGESRFFGIGTNAWVGLRAEASTKYSRWGTPEGTGILTWNVWFAPILHLGSEAGRRPL